MKKRIIALLTLLTMMFAILTSCDNSKKKDNDKDDEDDVKIVLNVKSLTLNLGASYQLEAQLKPQNSKTTEITWSSNNQAVAVVDDGMVYAVGVGTAKITAKAKGATSASCTVEVINPNTPGGNIPGGDVPVDNGPSWSVPAEGYDGSEVTITFYHTMSVTKLQPTLDLYIQEFNKLYPNITVVHSSPGSYYDVLDQIKNELAAGNQPNIAYCYPDHVASYLNAKAVVPLDNLINSQIPVTDAQGNTTILGLTDEQKADFVPGFYAEGAVYDSLGTMYTLPMSKSTEALYYDKTFFAEHNLTVPTTWEEMEAVCAQIKAIDPDCIPLGYDSESNWFITMCMQYDPTGALYTQLSQNKDYFKFDNETTRAFVETFKRWYDLGYLTTETIYGSYTSGLFTNTTPDYYTGVVQRCYMVIGSTGGASYQQPPTDRNGQPLFETGMATIPQVDPSNPQVISQGPSLCIFKSANPQEVVASWLFVEFLTTNAGFQAAFSMASGYAPVIQSAQNEALYQQWLNSGNGYTNLTAMSVKLALSQTDAYYVVPAFNGSSEARKQVGLIMTNVLGSDRTDIKALIDDEFRRAMEECVYSVQ